MICTVYLLTNIANGKIYIGQTWLPLKTRMGPNGNNYKNSIYLFNAIQKYGINNFKYQILAYCETQQYADKTESLLINIYNSRSPKIGYNLKEGGSAGKHSEETKKKISKTLKAQILQLTPGQLINKSKIISKYWLNKQRGPISEDKKEFISNFMKEWHLNNIHPMQGKIQSEETLLKISNASKQAWKDGKYSEAVKKSALNRMMSSEKELNIINAYKNKTIYEIERELKTSRSSIYRVLKRNNIVLKNEYYRNDN